MRYCGNGIGHANTREYTRGLWEELLDALGLLVTTADDASFASSDAAEDDLEEDLMGESVTEKLDSGDETDSGDEDEDSDDDSWQEDDEIKPDELEEDDDSFEDGLFGYSAL